MVNDNGRRLAQRAGLGLTFGAGLGLIVGVLAPSSSLALWIVGGAGVGMVIGAALSLLSGRRPGSGR